MTFQLLYRSRSVHARWHPSDLDILRHAIARNGQLGICGLLLRDRQQFYQVLEGGEAKVKDLFATIRKDKRHTDVACLLSRPIVKPIFANWSMGYQVAELTAAPIFSANSNPNRSTPYPDPISVITQLEKLAQLNVCPDKDAQDMIKDVRELDARKRRFGS